MFILVVPMFSVNQINKDSNYVLISETIGEILKKRPDWQFDIIWPSNHSDWEYHNDGLFDHPQIRRLPLFMHRHKMRQVSSFDVRAWDRYVGYKDNVYDLIWNNSPEIGGSLKFYETHYDLSGKSAVMNVHHWVLHKSLPYPVELGYEHVLLKGLIGSITADANLVISDHCRWMLLDNASRYLHPDQVARIEASLKQFPFGTLRPDDYPKRWKKHDTFTFAWNHRLQDYKGWKPTFQMFADLWKERQDFQVHYFGQYSPSLDPYPFVTQFDLDRTDYLKGLAKCHANVVNSKYETLCLAAIESMLFNAPPLAPNGVTFPEITGNLDGMDYPLLFNKPSEMKTMANRMIDHRDEVLAWGKKLRARALIEYTADTTADRLISTFEEIAFHDLTESTKQTPTWERLLGAQPVWPINDLRRAAYRATTPKGTRLAADQSWPTVKIKRLANQMGFIDSRDRQGRLVLTRGDT